jgi:membrane associated rhomboid family serine protease
MVIPGGSYRRGPPPYLTIGLIAANTAVYVYTSYQNYFLESSAGSIYGLGFTPYLLFSSPLQGVARVFTAMFTHADILHIFFNMYFLYLFGYSVENYLGRLRYLLVYFASGVVASLFHTAFSSVSDWGLLMTPAVGASGAISGVLGAYLILFPNTKMSMCTILVILPVCFPVASYVYMILWFALQVIYGYFTATAIATFAHVGGFLTGILGTWLIARRLTKQYQQTTGMSLADILVALGIILRGRRGLGGVAKGVLVALILAVVAGYLYGALGSVLARPQTYVLSVSADGVGDQVLMVLQGGGVYVTTSQVDEVRVLINRLQDTFFYDPSSANNTRVVQESYITQVSGVSVPVELRAEVTYGYGGVLKNATGVMLSRVVNVNPYTGVGRLGPSIQISFNISAAEVDWAVGVLALDVLAVVVSAATVVAVLRSEEASAIGEELDLLPFA